VSQSCAYDVLVIGELNVDLILKGDVVPEFGQVEKLVDDMLLCEGGSAAIFAASAAKMGLRVAYVSRVGDDPFGHYMVGRLCAVGIDTSRVHIDPDIRTGATVHLYRGQDRAMLTYLGSIAAVSADDLCPSDLSRARHLHIASPFLLTRLRPAMPELMCQAKAAGMTVSLDTNWDPENRWQFLCPMKTSSWPFPESPILNVRCARWRRASRWSRSSRELRERRA